MPKPKQPTRKRVPFKKLIIKKDYECFNDFYDTNKNTIYKLIVEVFSEFLNTRKKSLSLYISAKIQDLVWDTEFNFTKDEYFILKRDLMPYFEKIEDYETCCEIVKLYDELDK